MSGIDINRGTTNVVLPQEVSSEIWAATLDESAIMQLARKIELPGSGVSVQTITGEPVANWVAETGAKPVSNHTFGKKVITPYKVAVIEAFSDEFARDAEALYRECVRRLPNAIAKKFDSTVMGTTAPGPGFDVLGGCTQVSLTPESGKTVYDQFLTVDSNIAAAGGVMNGIGLAPQGKSKVLAAVDGDNRPLFTAGVESGTINPILGAGVTVAKGLYVAGSTDIVGLAGDFTDAAYGIVEGIKLEISNQATLVDGDDVISLWQNNMFAVRVEAEIGFSVRDAAEFNLLTA